MWTDILVLLVLAFQGAACSPQVSTRPPGCSRVIPLVLGQCISGLNFLCYLISAATQHITIIRGEVRKQALLGGPCTVCRMAISYGKEGGKAPFWAKFHSGVYTGYRRVVAGDRN